MNEKEAYERDHDKQKHINNIWRGDEVFVNKARSQRDDPIVGNIAAKMIQTKENLEKTNLLDTHRFERFGMDPAARLREMVHDQYNKKKKKGRSHGDRSELQRGGILPIVAAIGTVAATALAKKLVEDLYDYVKKKMSGSGLKIDHRTKNEKKQFLIEFLEKSK